MNKFNSFYNNNNNNTKSHEDSSSINENIGFLNKYLTQQIKKNEAKVCLYIHFYSTNYFFLEI